MKNNKLLVIIPTLNEKDTIEIAIRKIVAAIPAVWILVVDDDSVDGTWQIADDLKRGFSQIEIMVRRNVAHGLGYSIRDGFRYAIDHSFDEVCVVDCDLQQDPSDIVTMRKVFPTSDIVIGTRFCSSESFVAGYDIASRLMSRLSNLIIRVLFLFPYKDATTDFNWLSVRVFKGVPPESMISKGYVFFVELKIRAWKAGFSISELAVPTYPRTCGHSGRSVRQIGIFTLEVLKLWFHLRCPDGRDRLYD